VNRQRTYRILAPVLVLPLAFLWHFLGVWTFFPIGGADFHWIFQRPHGGSAEAVYVVAVVYAIVAGALAVFLLARTRQAGTWILLTLLLAATVLRPLLVGWEPLSEVALATLITGVPLLLVASLVVASPAVPPLIPAGCCRRDPRHMVPLGGV